MSRTGFRDTYDVIVFMEIGNSTLNGDRGLYCCRRARRFQCYLFFFVEVRVIESKSNPFRVFQFIRLRFRSVFLNCNFNAVSRRRITRPSLLNYWLPILVRIQIQISTMNIGGTKISLINIV